jgi:hypothetical protein
MMLLVGGVVTIIFLDQDGWELYRWKTQRILVLYQQKKKKKWRVAT